MLKKDEIANPNSCINKSKDDEPLFVLCARDVLAPGVVEEWAFRAQAAGVRPEKVQRAFEIADQMTAWQKANGSKTPD